MVLHPSQGRIAIVRTFVFPRQFVDGKFFIQQNTIYRHERLVCPFALCVYLFGDVFLARDALAQYRDTQVRGRDLPYLVVYLFNAPFVRSRMGTIIDTE